MRNWIGNNITTITYLIYFRLYKKSPAQREPGIFRIRLRRINSAGSYAH